MRVREGGEVLVTLLKGVTEGGNYLEGSDKESRYGMAEEQGGGQG